MTKKRFLLNTAIIAGTSLILKCAGLFFRVYLSNTIGAEGMGLYQLIFSMYVFLISLSSAGVSLSVTRIVSEQMGRACRMMEFDPIYCQVIINRWEALTGRKARKIC